MAHFLKKTRPISAPGSVAITFRYQWTKIKDRQRQIRRQVEMSRQRQEGDRGVARWQQLIRHRSSKKSNKSNNKKKKKSSSRLQTKKQLFVEGQMRKFVQNYFGKLNSAVAPTYGCFRLSFSQSADHARMNLSVWIPAFLAFLSKIKFILP